MDAFVIAGEEDEIASQVLYIFERDTTETFLSLFKGVAKIQGTAILVVYAKVVLLNAGYLLGVLLQY